MDNTALKNDGDGNIPYSSSFGTQLYDTEELVEELTNIYHQLIILMMWSIELVSIHILTELSCSYQHLCSLIKGHLDAVYRIFRYLQNNLCMNPGRMIYDSMYEPTYEKFFEVSGKYLDELKDFYPDAQ